MKILIINSSSENGNRFVIPIKDILSKKQVKTDIARFDNVPEDLQNYDAIIVSASAKPDLSVDKHIQHLQTLKKYDKPILGICAGHQTIGLLFGAQLKHDEEVEDGKFGVDIHTESPLFTGYSGAKTVEQHHVDSVTLPENFLLLASSPICKVQAMQHKSRPIFSIQWHAERSSPEVIENFVEIVRGFQTSLNKGYPIRK